MYGHKLSSDIYEQALDYFCAIAQAYIFLNKSLVHSAFGERSYGKRGIQYRLDERLSTPVYVWSSAQSIHLCADHRGPHSGKELNNKSDCLFLAEIFFHPKRTQFPWVRQLTGAFAPEPDSSSHNSCYLYELTRRICRILYSRISWFGRFFVGFLSCDYYSHEYPELQGALS